MDELLRAKKDYEKAIEEGVLLMIDKLFLECNSSSRSSRFFQQAEGDPSSSEGSLLILIFITEYTSGPHLEETSECKF